jgi:hypothetical protein
MRFDERTATRSLTKSAGKAPVVLGAFLEVGAAIIFFRRFPATPDAAGATTTATKESVTGDR